MFRHRSFTSCLIVPGGLSLTWKTKAINLGGMGAGPHNDKLVPFVKTVLRQFYGKLRLINDSRIIVSDIFQTELSLTSFRSNTNRPTGYDSWKNPYNGSLRLLSIICTTVLRSSHNSGFWRSVGIRRSRRGCGQCG